MKAIFITLLIGVSCSVFAQKTAWEVINSLGRGTNLGNTLEPPTEGGWNNGPAKEYYFDDYKTAGFKTVRVPVRWFTHTNKNAPYTIDTDWMNRVEEVIDWGLERDLWIILNLHHENEFKEEYDKYLDMYLAIWDQVLERFKNKSDKLLFEIINEPHGMTPAQVNDFNNKAYQKIRATSNTRIIIYGGDGWSNSDDLIDGDITIPNINDRYLIGYYHSYDPWSFGGESKGTWGTASDKTSMDKKYKSVADWASNKNIPVIISEFGANHKGHLNSRFKHYAANVEYSIKHNVPFQVWDDGGWFGIYQRDERGWNELKDIVIHYYPESVTDFNLSKNNETVNLSWVNRASGVENILVQRKLTSADKYTTLATVSAASESYTDIPSVSGTAYYRVITAFSDGREYYGYPQEIEITATTVTQSPFNGIPISIPGTIEAENYDNGGEGVSFHDSDALNKLGEYRTDGVDIEVCDDGGYNLGWITDGEWLEYTINVTETGTYTFTTRVASQSAGGSFHLEIDNKQIGPAQTVPVTDGWQTFTEVVLWDVELSVGEYTLKFVSGSAGYNFDKIEVAQAGVQQKTVSLKKGWNLVGCPIEGNTPIQTALSSIWDKVELVKDFDAYYDSSNDPLLNSLQDIKWGKGYFVKVSEDCELMW